MTMTRYTELQAAIQARPPDFDNSAGHLAPRGAGTTHVVRIFPQRPPLHPTCRRAVSRAAGMLSPACAG